MFKPGQNKIPKVLQKKVELSLIYLLLFLILLISIVGFYRGGIKLIELEAHNITIKELPYALTLSLLRMSVSYTGSLLFALFLGFFAAKSRTGEKIIIPLLDILQSVPVVGFFPVAISFFISITQGHRLGVELAACFLIFTSQAWNMAFAVFEAIKSIPKDQIDATHSFGLQPSKLFVYLYFPACIPRLIYNSILSWSNGWFFLVACEIIAVGSIHYHLPGIGSFLAQAAEQNQLSLIMWGLFSLTLLILFLDFLIWRPLSDWAQKYQHDSSIDESPTLTSGSSIPSYLIGILNPLLEPAKKLLNALSFPLIWILKEIALPLLWDLPFGLFQIFYKAFYIHIASPSLKSWNMFLNKLGQIKVFLGWGIFGIVFGYVGYKFYFWISNPWPSIAAQIPLAILASTGRLIIALFLSLLWVLPVVYFSWSKPKIKQSLTTIAQIGASLPAIALFPLIILVLVQKLGGGMESASILLLLTGMQWYLLFNCLGGSSNIPSDLVGVMRSLGLKNKHVWNHLVFPAMRPALITGAITAWGGGWNALVVSEYLSYKGEVLSVLGIGALLNRSVYEYGDTKSITFCITAMVAWIVAINLIFWQPLYHAAIERFKFDA